MLDGPGLISINIFLHVFCTTFTCLYREFILDNKKHNIKNNTLSN